MTEQSTRDKSTPTAEDQEETMMVTIARQNLQIPGVSAITAEEAHKHPPARGVPELIRTQPGVSLTGNSTNGQRGNNRQIDICDMGPENALVLVDGKPVTDRNPVRYSWYDDRDSRGDTSWVSAETIDHTDVIRGPTAARYGDGAMGGVVNITTKPTTSEWHGPQNTYMSVPQHREGGATKRTNFSLNGPLLNSVSFNPWGSLSETQTNAQDINTGHEAERAGSYAGSYPVRHEGMVNKDTHSKLC